MVVITLFNRGTGNRFSLLGDILDKPWSHVFSLLQNKLLLVSLLVYSALFAHGVGVVLFKPTSENA